jgi:hypothetical protein
MSEYQYYEFQAIDRPLTKREMDELRALSTRADITSTSFVNVYHYGDFRGDPRRLMEKYFDAFVYVANWGTRWLMLRVPSGLLDAEEAARYDAGDSASLRVQGEHAILEWRSQDEEGGDWEEGEGWMDELIPLRSELTAGDLRSLYLGWLLGVEQGEVDEDTPEPPLPPGLRSLSPSLQRLVDFLQIDPDLIEVAAERDAGTTPAGPSRSELEAWLKALPVEDRNGWLLRFAEETGPYVRAELLQQFRQAWKSQRGPSPASQAAGGKRRTAGELLAARDALGETKRRQAAEQQAREQARRDREKAEARARYLKELAGREPETWRQVEKLIESKQPRAYDEAVDLLKDLRDLAAGQGRKAEVEARLRDLRERHSAKSSLKRRLDQAGLKA